MYEVTMETYAVDLDDAHLVTVDPEVEHSECTSVDNTQTVRFTSFKWK